MHFTLNTVGWRQLQPRLFAAITASCQARSTSKIAVQVDGDLLTKLESNELKPRKHPGISPTHRIQLPAHINQALIRAIGDYPVKTLLEDCKRLNRFISARHPPAEKQELDARMRFILAEVDQKFPAERAAALSEQEQAKWNQRRENLLRRRLGQRTYAWKPIAYGAYEALVYAIGRSALEYGVLMHILHELRARDPSFTPRSYFDFGAGVGTGMWAASSLWKDSIFEYFNVDSSREMNDFSELLLRDGHENQQMTLRNVYYRQFLPRNETNFDLVLSSFALFELPSAQQRKDVLVNLWRRCDGYLIIVEEGTRRGSELVIEARDYLLGLFNDELKGHVFAPCPHDAPCPRMAAIKDNTPCNFEVKYAPLKVGEWRADQRTARYSYVVMKKGVEQDPTQHWPRLVRPTMARSKHSICRMCTADAKLQEIIFTESKHGRPAYRCARASQWGDRLPIKVGETFETETKTSSWQPKQLHKDEKTDADT